MHCQHSIPDKYECNSNTSLFTMECEKFDGTPLYKHHGLKNVLCLYEPLCSFLK